jgi:EAL domain-containing protein (putative c-di-GMP-specific phosphodiesterase class I)
MAESGALGTLHALGVLGMSAVGEGIETTGQRAFLQAEGCPLGQGFGLARPMPAAAVTERMLAAAGATG